jgi:hypothetical protein
MSTEPAQHRCDPDLAACEAPVTHARGICTEFTPLTGEYMMQFQNVIDWCRFDATCSSRPNGVLKQAT